MLSPICFEDKRLEVTFEVIELKICSKGNISNIETKISR